jgi:hypothetical protein
MLTPSTETCYKSHGTIGNIFSAYSLSTCSTTGQCTGFVNLRLGVRSSPRALNIGKLFIVYKKNGSHRGSSGTSSDEFWVTAIFTSSVHRVTPGEPILVRIMELGSTPTAINIPSGSLVWLSSRCTWTLVKNRIPQAPLPIQSSIINNNPIFILKCPLKGEARAVSPVIHFILGPFILYSVGEIA